MYLHDTKVVFACRLCKASFQTVDDFIEHKKEEHGVEFPTSNCIVFEDVLILNTSNDNDEDNNCGASSAVKERGSTSTVPCKKNPNVTASFGIENSLTDVDKPDLSHRTQHIPHDVADSFDQFPIFTTGDNENGDGHHNNTSYQDDNKAPGNFLQENVDDRESTDLSQAPADPILNFIEPKMELTEFETNRDEISKTDSVELIQFWQNPYVLLKKLSSKEIQNYSSRLQNQETHRAEVTSKPQCRLCLKKFNSEADLDIHCSVCILDSSSRVWYCVPCKKFFNSQRAQNMHQIRHHGADGEQLNLLLFKCSVCQKPYSRRDVLRNHMESHKETNEQKKPFKCDTCSASFFGKYDFRRHQASHASTRPFKCQEPDCKKSFKLKIHLSRHLKYNNHPNNKESFKCPEPNCTTVFKHKSSFEKHFRTFHTFHEKMP